MGYEDRYSQVDQIIENLEVLLANETDAQLLSYYAGFISVAAVTVFELAVKDIFSEFATRKHSVFGSFVDSTFSSVNGKIKVNDLKGYAGKFGSKYKNRLNKNLDSMTDSEQVITAYSNLITCRHKFVHASAPTLSYIEAINNYRRGKGIVKALDESMKR